MDWISVSDHKKPKKGQNVLVVQDPTTTATREALFAIYDGEYFIPPTPTIFADYTAGYSVWSDITHWMPLPEIPFKINRLIP
jgi:hypothetical protein